MGKASGGRRMTATMEPATTPDCFNRKDIELLELLVEGITYEEAAERLGLSFHSVKSRVRAALDRSGTRNRHHLVALYVRGTAANLRRKPPLGTRVFNPGSIRRYRQEAGLSCKDLAARIYRSEDALYDYVSGRSLPAADTLALLANALGRSVDDFYDTTPGGAR